MRKLVILLPALLLLTAKPGRTDNDLEIFGWIEPIYLPGFDLSLAAKLDTGADTSSLDAVNIRRVKRGGQRFVKFAVRNPRTEQLIDLERPWVRTTRIRRHSGEHQRRHVVKLDVCIGDRLRRVEVNLIDRSHFDYAMLLGRNALAGFALVDPGEKNVSTPDCDTEAAP